MRNLFLTLKTGKMKKNCYILIALCMTLLLGLIKPPVSAQEKSTIYAGYGVATHIEDVIISVITLGGIKSKYDNSPGAFYLGYRTFLTPKIEVGGVGIFQSSTYDAEVTGNVYAGRSLTYALLLDGRYNYLINAKFKLYSALAAGIAINTEKVKSLKTSAHQQDFAFHVDAIGLSYGKTIAPFINFGYGYKGLISGGIQMRF